MSVKNISKSFLGLIVIIFFSCFSKPSWQSGYVYESKGSLVYQPDENGNIIPDFSRVGYQQGDRDIPFIRVVKTILPVPNGESQAVIQQAIDEVGAMPPDDQGFRGAILLKKGIYKVPGTLRISKSGIVIRGEGDTENGTVIIASGKGQRSLLTLAGMGKRKEIPGTRVSILDHYVPVGAFSFSVENSSKFKIGDKIVIFRPGTEAWIRDLKMDLIVERPGTKQWEAGAYDLQYERTITAIEGDRITVDNPVVMAMEDKYGGGSVFKYSFEGRISEAGVENILFKSDYDSDTDEDHGWEAVRFDDAENCWAKNITSKYFGYSCVTVGNEGKNITITGSRCLDAKSEITGGRRYSFCVNGQMILVTNCEATQGRHDYVTGARVCGPNVFYNCKARNTHADIGPHHRWATGTLYDNIDTDGEINVQDRGNWGSGHGWAGANQVLWNCRAKAVCVQNPWVSATNYCIGLQGKKTSGRLPGRHDGIWEGQNQAGLQPVSLYLAQLKARKK